jgi:hypothetical protein
MSGSVNKFLSLTVEGTGQRVVISVNNILYMREAQLHTDIYLRGHESIYVKESLQEIEQALHSM